jgi:hypothetical protein
MPSMLQYITIADQFLAQRDWWQFHNPKNDAMNIMVETGELAEHFIAQEHPADASVCHDIAQEMSDVFFGSMIFALTTKIDISQAIGNIVGSTVFQDADASYEQLQDIVLHNREAFAINNLVSPRQAVMSLVHHVSQLSDLFVWGTSQESVLRAQEKRMIVATNLARIVAHQMLLASLMDLDLPAEYMRKMEKNGIKYPVDASTGSQYIKIKDQARNRA